MNAKFFIFIVVSIFYLTACGTGETDLYIKNHGGASNEIYSLDKTEKLDLESRSITSAEAAFRLFLYYTLSAPDIDEQMKYLKIAACLGSVTAQYSYGVYLSSPYKEYSKYYNLAEAIYWLELAEKKGNKYARLQLQQLKKT